MSDFVDKVVLITGASSGIGEALAKAFAKEGAVLALIARNEEKLAALTSAIEADGGTASFFPCDVTNDESTRVVVEQVIEEFGQIDVLIANAGIGGTSDPTKRFDMRQFRKVIDVNLNGAANCVAAVLPGMLKREEGHLVAISSLASIRGLPKSAAYSASKAAMNNLFESLRLDLVRSGIDVTIIQPGFIKTPLTAGRKNKMPFLMELEDSVPLFMKAIRKRKRFAAFPWQLATIVRAGRFFRLGYMIESPPESIIVVNG